MKTLQVHYFYGQRIIRVETRLGLSRHHCQLDVLPGAGKSLVIQDPLLDDHGLHKSSEYALCLLEENKYEPHMDTYLGIHYILKMFLSLSNHIQVLDNHTQ